MQRGKRHSEISFSSAISFVFCFSIVKATNTTLQRKKNCKKKKDTVRFHSLSAIPFALCFLTVRATKRALQLRKNRDKTGGIFRSHSPSAHLFVFCFSAVRATNREPQLQINVQFPARPPATFCVFSKCPRMLSRRVKVKQDTRRGSCSVVRSICEVSGCVSDRLHLMRLSKEFLNKAMWQRQERKQWLWKYW